MGYWLHWIEVVFRFEIKVVFGSGCVSEEWSCSVFPALNSSIQVTCLISSCYLCVCVLNVCFSGCIVFVCLCSLTGSVSKDK